MDKKYDLRKLIQRTYDNIPCDSEPEKAAMTVRIFDVEDEVGLSEIGSYRKADIVSVVESAIESKEKRMLAKAPDNLEEIAETKNKASSLRVAYEVVKEYGKICFRGALPTSYFHKNQEYGYDDGRKYILVNASIMCVSEMGSAVYFELSGNAPLAVILGALAISDLWRMSLTGKGFEFGHLLATIPYYTIKLPSIGIKALAKDIRDRFKQKKKELEMKYTTKLYQIENIEKKQLPSPGRKAIVNTELVEELLDRKLKK